MATVAEDMTFLFAGILVLLGAMIYGFGMTRVVVPKKIDDHYVWLTGIDDDYLAQFPELAARRA